MMVSVRLAYSKNRFVKGDGLAKQDMHRWQVEPTGLSRSGVSAGYASRLLVIKRIDHQDAIGIQS